jgi:CheY-like chemotaxis protein
MRHEDPSILIVEDEDDISFQLAAVLQQEGYAVRTAANGREAIESLERDGCPSLILLDLLLPELDGWQFMRAQASREEWRHVPVVAISAVSYRGAPGAAAIVPKPIDLSALIQIIHQVRSGTLRAVS